MHIINFQAPVPTQAPVPAQAPATSIVYAILEKAVRSRDAARFEGSSSPAGRRHRARAEAYLDAATMAAGKQHAVSELCRMLFFGCSGAGALASALDEFDRYTH